MIHNPLIILGSSRGDGDTRKAIDAVLQTKDIPVIDLSDIEMSYYDYEHKNADDDFVPLMERVMQHDPIILATPIYWYTMSGIMKVFLDRWTDLLEIRKDLGRKMKGKSLFLITSYAGVIPKAFEDPFSLTCEYMHMKYKGCLYYYSGVDAPIKQKNAHLLDTFVQSLNK